MIRGPYTLVTGGAGFIGTNLADALARSGHPVVILDNLSRQGVSENLRWTLQNHADRVHFIRGDIRDRDAVAEAVSGAESIYHFAAQVAVTSSLQDPIQDFEINARGTLNLLEAIREKEVPPFLLYTSTNKVLGGLEDVGLLEGDRRYYPQDEAIRQYGIAESRGIDFCSPYGCSKGAADQYVLDYSRCYGIPAVVFRMSCIYGLHQCGNEDQGWVAHFVRQTLEGKVIQLYGDGKQVRDALFADDLVLAFLLARENIRDLTGKAFTIGGGPQNSTSLLELIETIAEIHGERPEIRRGPWRQSDQRYFVSDNRSFSELTGWKPRTTIRNGIEKLHSWMKGHPPLEQAA